MVANKSFLSFEEFINENKRETLPSETEQGSTENKDLEDIRFFRGSIRQWNDFLAQKIKETGNEVNPYKNMQYLYPHKRTEIEPDAITYQDFMNGTSEKSKRLNNISKTEDK